MLAPNTSDSTKSTKKIKNKTLAIEAAPAAIPPNPKMAATIAIIRKVTVQRNIVIKFKGLNLFYNIEDAEGICFTQHPPSQLVLILVSMNRAKYLRQAT